VELVDIYHGWLLPGQLYRGDIFEYMAEAVTSSSLSDPTPTFARRGVTHTTEFVTRTETQKHAHETQHAQPTPVALQRDMWHV